jgi:hypothetical protein
MAERNWGCRISLEHTYKGYRAVVMQNDLLRVTILADKGGDIVEFLHKPSDTDFMWWTPWGLHAKGAFIPSSAHSGGEFGDRYEGGWQEIFPSGGTANKHDNIEYGLHGEASLLPWAARIVKDSADEVELELTVETVRSPFRCVKRLSLKRGVGALFIEEELRNIGESPCDAMWGHHPAFGAPFLSPDCRIDLPGATAEYHIEFSEMPRFERGTEGRWPRIAGKDGTLIDISKFPDPKRRSADMFYLKALKGNWYGLTNAATKVGFGMAWDLKTFPYLWFWQVYKGGVGTPFWGRTYNCALEPFSSIPSGLANAHKRGTHMTFKPGQSRKTWLTAVAYAGKTRVKKVGRDGHVA